METRFRVECLAATPDPNVVCWQAMHQDYSDRFVFDEECPDESAAGEALVKHLLANDRGHFGCLEHPQITFAVGGFPHDVMQQARTHRVGVSFDVQSGRYTGKRISAAARGELSIEDVFYLRPIGKYHDRKGHRFHYDEKQRMADLEILRTLAELYRRKVDEDGFAEEHARGLIPYALRQDFVVSFNARSLMHFLDLRAKADAQLEIRQLCDLLFPFFGEWMPEVAEWYCIHRLKKARLSP